MTKLALVLIQILLVKGAPLEGFELNIVHINDFHARYDQISNTSSACKDEVKYCIGGFARIYTVINQLARKPNTLVLNGGDNFQGTLWYGIYRWNVTQHFLNLLPFDAMTLGNHEFDHDIEGVIPFLKALKVPVVVANIDDSQEPEIQGLYKKSVVVEKSGRKIGIVGVISHVTHELSNPGKLKFLNETLSVNQEANRLVGEENVDTVVVVSHCGYEADKEIARNAAPKISVIVGAHSHSFLYSGSPVPGLDKPKGPYPTVINHQDGRKILIVQAGALSKYVGNLTVKYDHEGNIVSWSGAPIYLNNSIKEDENIKGQLEEWKKGLIEKGNRVLGHTNVLLKHSNCRFAECNLGNFITDAMVYNYISTAEKGPWTEASIAIINSGGIKSSIQPGNITYSDLILTLPFGNTFNVGEIKGEHLKAALEYSVSNANNWGGSSMNLLQVSGLRVVYNINKPKGSRVVSVRVRCRKCDVPDYEDLDEGKMYRVVFNSYLARGGEGHNILANNVINRRVGELDVDVMERYVRKHSPIVQELQGRIQITS